jgi:hypothetical protein
MNVFLERLAARLAPSRLRVLWVLLDIFLAVNALVRIGLTVFNGDLGVWWPWRLVPVLAIGLARQRSVAESP